MCANVQAKPASDADVRSGNLRVLVDVEPTRDTCVVHITGELDRATRNQLVSASTAGHHQNMTIDLGGITFMDSSGFSALTIARHIIESQGRSLTITGQTGQPARLIEIIAGLE